MALREWSRRDFLRAAGIGGAASALLPFMPVAHAQTATGIKRLLLFTTPDGTILNRWRSNGTGTPFVGSPAAGTAMNSMATPALVGPILSPLERHRAKITLVDGLDNRSGDLPRPGTTNYHGSGHNGVGTLWSGARQINAPASQIAAPSYSNAATIDQILAASSTTRFRSLTVSTNDYAKQTYAPTMGMFSYSAASKPVIGESNPQALFDLLFGSGVDQSANDAAKRRASRRSIFASVKGELTRVRAELPTIDKDRLDIHLAGLADLDQRIAAQATAPVCASPTRPATAGSANDPAARLALQIDIITHAFACDLTRVASMMLGNEASTETWVSGENVHTTSHETYIADTEAQRQAAIATLTDLQKNAAEQFAKLIDAVDGAALLDDTLMAWGMGMGWGGPHTNYNIPFVLASKHASFVAGRYHRFGNYNLNIDTMSSGSGAAYTPPTIITPHNRLLTTMMHLMGRPDITKVGDVGTGTEIGGADLDNSIISELIQ